MQKAPQRTQSSEEQPIFGTSLNRDDADVSISDYKGILPRLKFGLEDRKPGWCRSGPKIFNAFDFMWTLRSAISKLQKSNCWHRLPKCINPGCRCSGKQLECSYHETNFRQLCRYMYPPCAIYVTFISTSKGMQTCSGGGAVPRENILISW